MSNRRNFCHLVRSGERDRKGATTVEFAIVAPLFFFLLFACFEFTRAYMMKGLAEDAVYKAARSCIVLGAKKSEAVAEVTRILSVLGTRNADINVQAFDGSSEQPDIDDETDQVVVTVEIPLADNLLVFPTFTANTRMRSSISIATDRYGGFFDGQSF